MKAGERKFKVVLKPIDEVTFEVVAKSDVLALAEAKRMWKEKYGDPDATIEEDFL